MHHRAASFARLLLAGALALGTAAPALAAEHGGAPDSGQEGAQVDPEKLERFVAAYAEVQSIRAEYMPRLQQAGDAEEQAKLKKEGQEKMVNAIRDEGLDVSEYQRIGQTINSDRELRGRVKKLIEEHRSAQEE